MSNRMVSPSHTDISFPPVLFLLLVVVVVLLAAEETTYSVSPSDATTTLRLVLGVNSIENFNSRFCLDSFLILIHVSTTHLLNISLVFGISSQNSRDFSTEIQANKFLLNWVPGLCGAAVVPQERREYPRVVRFGVEDGEGGGGVGSVDLGSNSIEKFVARKTT